MRIPVRHVAGNVIWTRHGTCWALWRVQAGGHAHASRGAKEQRLRAVESLVKSLRGEAMLLSLCPQVEPAAVVRRMTDGVDLAGSERYAVLALRVLDQLEDLELTGRADWLAVPLPAAGGMDAARMAWAAARGEMALQLGLLPAPVSAREEVRRLTQARELAAPWPSTVKLRPATEAEILWIYGHSARRGVLEPLLPEPGQGPVRGRGRGQRRWARSSSPRAARQMRLRVPESTAKTARPRQAGHRPTVAGGCRWRPNGASPTRPS